MARTENSEIGVSKRKAKSRPREKILTLIRIVAVTAWTCGTVLLCQLLVALLFRWLYQITNIHTTLLQTLYTVFSYVLAIIIIIFLPRCFKKHKQHTSRAELGLIGLPTWMDLGLAPVAFIIYAVLAAIVTNLFSIFPWFNAAEAQDVGFSGLLFGFDRILAFFALVVVAPIAEELIFRGYLYGKLKTILEKRETKSMAEGANSKMLAPKSKTAKKGSRRTELVAIIIASLITSLAFAILHGQWNVGVNVFVLSLVLCALREITGTIYSGIILHMLKNAVAFVLLYIFTFG